MSDWAWINHEPVLRAGLAWLFDTAQPDGAILQHHGILLGSHGGRRLSFCPAGSNDRPVVAIEVPYPQQLGPAEVNSLEAQLAAYGATPVHRWNGYPSNSGSVALAGRAHPTLLAAVQRYRAGCPTHSGSVFCKCGWYEAGYAQIIRPQRPVPVRQP